jgi:hypothetical protein
MSLAVVYYGGVYFGKVLGETYKGLKVQLFDRDERVVVVPRKDVQIKTFYEGKSPDEDFMCQSLAEVGKTVNPVLTFPVMLDKTPREPPFVFFGTVGGELKFGELEGRTPYATADEAARNSSRFGSEWLVISAVKDGAGYSAVAIYCVQVRENMFDRFLNIPCISVNLESRSLWNAHVEVDEFGPLSKKKHGTTAVALRQWDNEMYQMYLNSDWPHPDAHLALVCGALIASFRQNKLDMAATILGMLPTLFRKLILEDHWVAEIIEIMRKRPEEFSGICGDVPSLCVPMSIILCGTELLREKEKEQRFMKAMVGECVVRAAKLAADNAFSVKDVVKDGTYDMLQTIRDTYFWMEKKSDFNLFDLISCWAVAKGTLAGVEAETVPVFSSHSQPGARKAVSAFFEQIFGHSNYNFLLMFMFVFVLKHDEPAPTTLSLHEMHSLLKLM